MARFSHLHTHSHYSLLAALPKIDELVAAATENGMTSLGLTDSGNLYGAIEFYKAAEAAGLKPIIGVDFYVAARTRKDMQAGIDNRRSRLVLLAADATGYKNLLQLVTRSNLEGFYYKPRIDRELLERLNQGLIAISPSFSGEIAQLLSGRNQDKAIEAADFYKGVFGNRLYLEITKHPEIDGHEAAMKTLAEFGHSRKIPLMAAHDVYYLRPEDRFARQTLVLVNSHTDASERVRESDEDDFSFISVERAEELFRDLPEALENTALIAERCSLKLSLGHWVFPDVKVTSGRTYDEELKHLVYEGFARRSIEPTEKIRERADYELKVIRDKGYAPYFLLVADLLRYARENGILSNIRGSVSGSMVTFLAGITNINPIEYEIPFERFLNPDRPSPPDIDMDYADDRRDDVIDYVRRKYGADKVAQIGTFGTMAARGSVRDVARAMGFPYDVGDRIAKLIPMGSQGFPMTIDRALEDVPELKAIHRDEEDTHRIIEMARKIEGCARHIGVHAAGVVVAPSALTDYTPLQFDPKGEGKIITQYDMYSIEEAGLLKFDFLGLKNLTIIADTAARIEKMTGLKVDVDNIPVGDAPTYEMLARGETADLFQLNGDGMTRFLKDLKPTSIHDINAMVALYRPGPIQFIPDYIERKHNPELVKYLDPALERILKKTYGVLVYQDDLLTMAHDLAGYSWIEVDKFRKAVGKKIPQEMAEQKEKFIKGCMTKSKWSHKKAAEVWKWIEPFAAYGFNKAHSVSYGRVAYITAYLKAHYPEIYLSAVLTSEQGETEKVAETITECKRLKIPVLPPDVNESFSQFTVVKDDPAKDEQPTYRIRFGLVTIKNFGQGVSTSIIEERKKNGPYTSLADFLDRVEDRNLNKKSLESLIKSGALDCFGEDRGVMLFNIDLMLDYNKESERGQENQDSLFGLMADHSSVPSLRLQPSPKAEMRDKLNWEKELLGLYVSGHPLERYREIIAKKDIDIRRAKENGAEGSSVIFAAIINEVRTVQTKNNETMAFITISDFSGSAEAVVFPRTYREFRALMAPDKCLAIKATVNTRNGEKGFAVERVKEL
ncbi:MAG: polymerase subunit alpha [Candidatus Parcubacteria bacterium]|jgi:DNA polymerase-3 subunit alpha|nr:polymerase subunit alpha [Candidatus Parcubacteria bacterium]